MGKTSHKEKTLLSDFKVTTPKNPLINNQAVISIRNLTNYLPHKTKTPLGDFKVITSKNLLINNQTVTSIRNLTNYLWPILKYQHTVEPSFQYPIGLDLVVVFFPLRHKFSICD